MMPTIPSFGCSFILFLLLACFRPVSCESADTIGVIDYSDSCVWTFDKSSVNEFAFSKIQRKPLENGCYEYAIVVNNDTPEYSIDILSNPANTTDQYDLSKRTDLKSCLSNTEEGTKKGWSSETKRWSVTTALTIAFGIGGIVYAASKENKCLGQYGDEFLVNSIAEGGGSGGVIVYYKLKTYGKDCDTTAQLSTLAGGLYELFKQRDLIGSDGTMIVPKAGCVYLTHGGTWRSELIIGYDKDAVQTATCDTTARVGQCVSGGKNDLRRRLLN